MRNMPDYKWYLDFYKDIFFAAVLPTIATFFLVFVMLWLALWLLGNDPPEYDCTHFRGNVYMCVLEGE